MSQEQHDFKGKVDIILKDKNGQVIKHRVVMNMIVNTGRELVAQLFAGHKNNKIINVWVGTLGDEYFPEHELENRVPVAAKPITDDNVVITKNANKAKLTFSSTFGADEANAKLKEGGIVFSDKDASTDDILNEGTLYNGVTFSPIDKAEGDELTLKWEIIF